jgi:hypothetical protein
VKKIPIRAQTFGGSSRPLMLIVVVLLQLFLCQTFGAAKLKAALLAPEQVSESKLANLKAESYTAVGISLSESNPAAQASAAARISHSTLDLYYWIEIGRNPALAEAHPEWMASIQTHQEYRRFFPELPKLETNQVVKNYPWVPVLYRETFPVHLERVRKLLEGKPQPAGIFLNDLQGSPSACGCGHHLCRWTTDYGPLRTATRLPNDAAARFVGEVQKLTPKARIIPVWTSECEEVDAKTLCAGVNCFKGTCWREFTAQLQAVAETSETIGALLPYKAFRRDLAEYGPTAGWISHALDSFSKMPMRYASNGVPTSRLIAVLQGWDVTSQQIGAQLEQTQNAGAAGVLVSFVPIEQDWEPRVFNMPAVSR